MGFVMDYWGLEESPDAWTRANAIIDFWMDPCDAPAWVYVETLLPVAGRLVIMLVDFDMLDLLRSCTRPNTGLGRGARRSKGRRKRPSPGIPETSDLACAMVPGTSVFHATRTYGLTRFLWLLDNLSQKVFYYILIADMALDGFFWWATLIRRTEFCQRDYAPSLSATNDGLTLPAAGGEWVSLPGWTLVHRDPGIAWNDGAIGLPPGNWTLNLSGACQSNNPNARVQFRWRSTSGDQYSPEFNPSGGDGSGGKFWFSANLGGSFGIYVPQFNVTGALTVELTEAEEFVTATF